jgi:hypothetical protein
MRLLSRLAAPRFSYVLRSPISVELLKTQEGRDSLRKSMRARFKDEHLLDDLHRSYEAFRTSRDFLIETCMSSSC